MHCSIYAHCMEEIKMRLDVIACVFEGEIVLKYNICIREFVCLQFRKICELIVFASLSANIEEYKKIRSHYEKDWSFNRITEKIKSFNPKYYPRPVMEKKPIIKNNKQIRNIVDIKNDFLTEDDLREIYSDCSGYIHETNPYNQSKSIESDLEEFKKKCYDWQIRIMKLLNHHYVEIKSTGEKLQLAVIMQAEDDGKVHVVVLERYSL